MGSCLAAECMGVHGEGRYISSCRAESGIDEGLLESWSKPLSGSEFDYVLVPYVLHTNLL